MAEHAVVALLLAARERVIAAEEQPRTCTIAECGQFQATQPVIATLVVERDVVENLHLRQWWLGDDSYHLAFAVGNKLQAQRLEVYEQGVGRRVVRPGRLIVEVA